MDYGIKISKEGYDVRTASEQELAFTSKYPVLKAFMYGIASISGVTEITHNLGYRPAHIVWAKGDVYRFKLPRIYLGADPIGGNVTGYCYVTTTKLYINTSATEVYYYIFIDEI